MDKKINKYTLKYDENRDVLYISIGRPKKAVSVLDNEEFIIRYAKYNKAFCGITIINLNEYWSNHKRKFANHFKKYIKDLPAKNVFQFLESSH